MKDNYIDTYEILIEQKKLLKDTLIKTNDLDEKTKLINNIVDIDLKINTYTKFLSKDNNHNIK